MFDDIQAKGAAYRLTEEALYAEALREIESGQRRDGLWAKAMAESNMDQGKAQAKYIKLRVQSLRDEATLFIAKVKTLDSTPQPTRIEKTHTPITQRVVAKPTKPIVGAAQGAACGLAGFFLFGYVLAESPKAQMQFDGVTFLFFVLAGALVGLFYSLLRR